MKTEQILFLYKGEKMKKLFYGLLAIMLAVPAIAEQYTNEAEIDLDSIKFDRKTDSAEINMKIYNENYEPNRNEIYYAIYYLKMDCLKKTYKPMLIEGYNKMQQLMIVDYDSKEMKPIAAGSNLEQAYFYACQIRTAPNVSK